MAKKESNICKHQNEYLKPGYPQQEDCRVQSEVRKNLAKEKVASRRSTASVTARRFSSYCDEWLIMNRTHVKESTYAKYCVNVENHIKPKLGDYAVQVLSSASVEQFSYELLFEEGLSAKTVKDILTMLKAILKYTVRQYPGKMQQIDVIYPKYAKKEMRVLSREEEARFISYLTSDMNQCKFSVLLALFTGMRIGEVCALRWKNVLLQDKLIKVNATMQRLHDFSKNSPSQTKIIISNPKSQTSARLIPMTDVVLSLFQKQGPKTGEAFVLTGECDHYIEPRTLQYWLGKYTKECGLDGVHFHTLRHTFATRCVEVDFELKSLSEILGHSSPRITLERYVHTSMELKRENMKKLEAIGF